MTMKPGERRHSILQMLATMLENPRSEKVTTAALAAKLEVSEAALYRHFASKAQMYEGLIEFIETTLFSFINKIQTETTEGAAQAANGWHGDAQADAAVLIAYVLGRWQLFAKSGFKRAPQDGWALQRKFLFG